MFNYYRKIENNLNWIRILLVISTFVLIYLSILVHQKLINNASDDSYIHIRIASNLALYSHPYYNLSDNVFSTSSFLWTILLGIAFKIAPQTPNTVAVINAILWTLSGIAFGYLAYILNGNRRKVFVSLITTIIILSMLFESSYSLMETPLAIFLLALATVSFHAKCKFAYILIGLLPHVRYEFVIYVIVYLLISIFIYKDNLLRVFSQLFIVNLPILLIEVNLYNTIIPNTILAKTALYDVPIINNLIIVLQSIIPIKLSKFSIIICGTSIIILALFMIISSLKRTIRNEIKRTSQNSLYTSFALFSGSIILMVMYIVSGSIIFQWYIMLYAIPFIVSMICFSVIMNNKILIYMVISLTINTVYSEISLFEQSIWGGISPPLTQSAARVLNYKNIGQWVQKKYPEAKVMTSEIGGLGYGFHGYVYDGAGLITPEAIKYHPLRVPDQRKDGSIGAIPNDFIATIKPDIIISYDFFIEDFLQNEIRKDYIQIQKPALRDEDSYYFTNVFGDKYINIFIRKDY